MPNYLIDINLIAGGPADYAKLSIEMKRNSFRTVAGDGSVAANNFFTSRESIVDVMTDVSRSAHSTGKKFRFTVIREKKGSRPD